MGELSHRQEGEWLKVLPGPSQEAREIPGGQYDVPANQGNQVDRGKGAGNEPGAGLGGKYEVPASPEREAGQQGRHQQAQEGSPAPEQHQYPRRERRMPVKLKHFKWRSQKSDLRFQNWPGGTGKRVRWRRSTMDSY